LLSLGCGASPPPAPEPPPVPTSAPPVAPATTRVPSAAPQTAVPVAATGADAVARRIAGPGGTGVVHLDRWRGHPLAPRLFALVPTLVPALATLPLAALEKDVDRIYFAMAGARDEDRSVAVVEHRIAEDRLRGLVDELRRRSEPPGVWLKDRPATAELTVRGRRLVVALAREGLVVLAGRKLADELAAFEASAGLPAPSDDDALVIEADKPSEVLRGRGAPRLPPTLAWARLAARPTEGGGVRGRFEARSSDEAQARRDAEALSRTMESASTLKISVLRVRLFEPVRFRAEGDRVRAERELDRAELERLLGAAAMLASVGKK
jgi:hypothetical protein